MPTSFEVGEVVGAREGTSAATQFGVQGSPCRERRGKKAERSGRVGGSWSH